MIYNYNEVIYVNALIEKTMKNLEKNKMNAFYVDTKEDGCIVRGRGKNVRANRMKSGTIEGYLSIGCMANAIRTRRAVYDTLVASL